MCTEFKSKPLRRIQIMPLMHTKKCLLCSLCHRPLADIAYEARSWYSSIQLSCCSTQLSSTQLHTVKLCMQCAMICIGMKLHNNWPKISTFITLVFQNVQCFAHFIIFFENFGLLPFVSQWIRNGNHKKFPSLLIASSVKTIAIHNWT